MFHRSVLVYLFSSFESFVKYVEHFVERDVNNSTNEVNNAFPPIQLDDMKVCQYCLGQFLLSKKHSQKEQDKYVRHISNFISANKEDSGHLFLNQKKNDYNAGINL